MPIYEFYCDSCGHEFEKIVSFSATQAPDCPSCAANTVSRRVSRPAIHFNGSGWYITDSKKGNGSGTGNGSANGGSTNGSSTKPESTSESPAKAESSESTTTTKSESSSEKTTVKTDT